MPPKQTNSTTKPCNVDDINYDLTFVEKLQTSAPALAGIFKFPTTQELWDLVQSDPSTKPVFDAWAGERKNFPANLRGVTHSRLMALASKPGFHTVLTSGKHPAFQSQNQNPAQGKVEINGLNLPHLTALWYITRLIKEKPALFPGSRVAVSAGEEMTFDVYDVFHGWKLLRWIWWVKVPKTKPRVATAIPPVYHTECTTGGASNGSDGSSGGDELSSSVVNDEDAKDNTPIKPDTATEDTIQSTDENTVQDTTSQDTTQNVDCQDAAVNANNEVIQATATIEASHQDSQGALEDTCSEDTSQNVESKDTTIVKDSADQDASYEAAEEDNSGDTSGRSLTLDIDTKQIKSESIQSTPKRGPPKDEEGEGETGVLKKSKTC